MIFVPNLVQQFTITKLDQKEFNISGRSVKFESIVNELDKCDLLCSNCHREVHWKLKYS